MIEFKDRESELKKIVRFELFPLMHYRTDLLLHSKRVYFLLKEIIPIAVKVYGEKFNPEKALNLALIHDDAELITGDIQLGEKLKMTPEQLQKIDDDEANAIEELSKEWPAKINGFSYKKLLYHALKKDCIEAQVVSYCDKLDAYCESLHELSAGNSFFTASLKVYTKILINFAEDFPDLNPLLNNENQFFQKPVWLNYDIILEKAKLHTEESLKEKNGFYPYEKWKEITIEHLGIGKLTSVIESNN